MEEIKNTPKISNTEYENLITKSLNLENNKEKSIVDESQNKKEVSDSDSAEEETKPKSNGQSELTLEFIQSKWSDFVHYVSSHKPSVGTILESCVVQNIDHKQLHISLFDQPKFNFSVLERNKHWIAHSLEQMISYPVIIKFILEEKKKKTINLLELTQMV